jgi:hypothetical protein
MPIHDHITLTLFAKRPKPAAGAGVAVRPTGAQLVMPLL